MQATIDPPRPDLAEDPLLPPPPANRSLFRRVLQDRAALLDEIVEGKAHDLTKVILASVLLTALGGLALGVASPHPVQILMAALKTPLIMLGALVVCFPAFYIFAVLQGSQLTLSKAARLCIVGAGLRGAIIAGLAPLLLFFASVGSPYGFLLIAGMITFGLAEAGFLHTIRQGVTRLRASGDKISMAFTHGWMVIYLAVVMQFTWSMRPIIGLCAHNPDPALDICHWAYVGGGPGGNMFTHFISQVTKLVS